MSLGLLQRVLSRSTGLLDVVDSQKGVPVRDSVFIDHVVRHTHRWRPLTATRPKVEEWYERLAPLSIPRMEVLDPDGFSVTDIGIGKLKSLHTLLRNDPSTDQLLAILAICQGLIELELVRFGSRHNDSDYTALQTMQVVLLTLETLKITGVPQKLTHSLLTVLHIPKCTSFTIDYHQASVTEHGLFSDPMLAHITSSLIASLRPSSGILNCNKSPYQL
ncbi:hypothetical protein FRB94_006245 [Tulasnella sp. JGI-2019a]|nr:hypothetical protein FRB94_006245 [Tulasnella sp. JGI-2019a]